MGVARICERQYETADIGFQQHGKDVVERDVAVMRGFRVAPAHVQPHPFARDAPDRLVDDRDDLLDEADKCANRLVLEGDVAFEREIGCIDLQEEAVGHDRLILDPQGSPESGEVGLERVVVFVAHRHGEDAGRRRAHEWFRERTGGLGEHAPKIAAFVGNGLRIDIFHLADRLGQATERGDLGAAGMLLHPHPFELRIAVDVGAGRPLPAAAEPGQPAPEIEKKGIALLLAVVADVDAGLALPVDALPHGIAAGAHDLGLIHRRAGSAQRIKARQLSRPRQAAGVSGENSRGAALHGIISTCGAAATAQGPATE